MSPSATKNNQLGNPLPNKTSDNAVAAPAVDRWLAVAALVLAVAGGHLFTLESTCQAQATVPAGSANSPADRPEILRRQQKLLDDYRLLEEKLFTLYQYEKDKNPARSNLLERAYQQSQQSTTIAKLELSADFLSDAKLKQAESEQAQSVANLNNLLALLQSEDRGKRVRDELERYQAYLKEVERLLRIQKGLRGQTEGGGDEQKIAQSQSNAADRAQKLADEIKQNEEQPDPETAADSQPIKPAENPAGDQGDPDDSGDPNDSRDLDDPDGASEKSSAQDRSIQNGAPDAVPPRSDSPATPTPPPAGDLPADSPADSPADFPADDGLGRTQPSNPIANRITNAQDRMRDAQQHLQQAKRQQAIDEMEAAEQEIAEAKKQLQEILRQLREEEVERTLAMLEGRFRKMLQRQMEVKDSTEKLADTAAEQRSTDFDIQTGKLATVQNSIATDASRALLLLREDGSSVAFPATVEEMQLDMLQIAARLSAAKVDQFTIELENDVIGTLNYLVESLAQTQKDKEQEKSAGSPNAAPPQSQPGDEALVGKIAELKMLRGLQQRIYQRHQRYAQSLDDPESPTAIANRPDLVEGLKRLAEKQHKLTRIAQDIVNERNQ